MTFIAAALDDSSLQQRSITYFSCDSRKFVTTVGCGVWCVHIRNMTRNNDVSSGDSANDVFTARHKRSRIRLKHSNTTESAVVPSTRKTDASATSPGRSDSTSRSLSASSQGTDDDLKDVSLFFAFRDCIYTSMSM
ncbi:hypothetical protein AB6A40_001698 [Gnathostoma spinigerum]|uniref:Uncharacterized protein n=1 Tax=Gnathostoma spinigerum TaxID=75299 RepID=A0ABD6ECC2_9BILA